MFLAGARHESAAVQPHHHRSLLVGMDARSPKVHTQAVLTLDPIVVAENPGFFIFVPGFAWTLRTHSAILHRTAYSGPGFGFLRGLKPPASFRGFTVGYAFVGVDFVSEIAADLPGGDFYDRSFIACDNRRFVGQLGSTDVFL